MMVESDLNGKKELAEIWWQNVSTMQMSRYRREHNKQELNMYYKDREEKIV